MHSRHRPIPISIHVKHAHAALAASEEGSIRSSSFLRPITKEERMRRYPRFRRRTDERVGC